ncbi:pectate lyase [uncultured Bacteroides sp.]|uniref:pectate lyase n=1 Tax=uncultured Bacteroides sp. TaxID=162156 RepID=UPI002AA860AD|nr:pectate lyase [uncultured Bacteroides sp.]
MKKNILILFVLSLMMGEAFAQTLAFPGAEGYGKYTTGGRGGKVLIVSNLNDSGAGSLRNAVEQQGARTVVFAVSGNIVLKSSLRINNDSITIAGQSAPGEGICLAEYSLVINASNVIVRYLHVRLGDLHKLDNDGVGGGRYGQKNVILDHLSVSWSIDECLSMYKMQNLTVQWCLVAHSLNKSVHTKGSHGFGGIWGGYKATFHHNLLANNASRNPRFSSVDSTKMVDYRNNVIYNWGFKSAYGGGHHGEINMVANYYKPGPASQHHRILDVAEDGTGRYYIADNYMEGDPKVTANNWGAVGGKDVQASHVTAPFAFEPIRQDTPLQAYKRVLNAVGCSLHRDAYDKHILMQVPRGLGLDGDKGLINSQNDVGGWPVLKSGKVLTDSDGDGIPDNWERSHGLNSLDSSDGMLYTLSKDYTNVEVYLNSLISDK